MNMNSLWKKASAAQRWGWRIICLATFITIFPIIPPLAFGLRHGNAAMVAITMGIGFFFGVMGIVSLTERRPVVPMRVLFAKVTDWGHPDVLGLLLSYLKVKLLWPKNEFVRKLGADIQRLQEELDIYSRDERALNKSLASTPDDNERAIINQSALLRIKQIIPAIGERKAILDAQVKRADEIVAPVVAQVNELQEHLDRLTRDERVAKSIKLISRLDKRIPVNEAYLDKLSVSVVAAKNALGELACETKALQTAWAEVRLDSIVEVEHEVQLNG